jgi:hypothetical protein
MTPADSQLWPILERTAVPGYRQLFAIGVLGRPSARFVEQPRVTLCSQQVRACNLAFALIHSGTIGPNARIAVIGGGITGVTIAAALSHHGHQVTVLERRPGLMPLQSGSTQRWLHPHLIDWPKPGSADEEAGLPLLNWRAAPASEVFRQLSVALAPYRLQVAGGVQELRVAPRASGAAPGAAGWELTFHNRSQHFHTVILAVGFGAEKTFPGLQLGSYWDVDNLDRDAVAPQVGSSHCFISGTGDGGLIDFIRARLYRFDHEDTFRGFLQAAADPELHRELLQLDEEAGADPGRLATGYESVRVPSAVDEFLSQRLHPQRSATLHGKLDFPYSPSASLLNRFITSRILRLDGVSGASRYESRELLNPIQREAEGFTVRVAEAGAHGSCYKARFDQVIIRHGTDSALALLPAPLAAACQQLASQLRAEPDPTRARCWPSGFFGPESAPLAAAAPRFHAPAPILPRPAAIQAPPFMPAGPPRIDWPTLPSLNRYLHAVFANGAELEIFLNQYFPRIAQQLGSGMKFDMIANMLLAVRGGNRVPRPQLLAALRDYLPEQTARAEHLLQPGEPD